jgi:hypothetical protein
MATLIWQSKTASGGTYADMPQPSTYGVDEEDLDKDSYRSVNTGNLIDNVISKSWVKLRLSYSHLTEAEMKSILGLLRYNPLYVKVKEPLFNTEYQEYQVRCSRKSYDMNQDGTWKLSFNLVQKTKETGQ